MKFKVNACHSVVNGINKISLLSVHITFALSLSLTLTKHQFGRPSFPGANVCVYLFAFTCIAYLANVLFLFRYFLLIFLFLLSPFRIQIRNSHYYYFFFWQNIIHMYVNVCRRAQSCHRINKMYDLYICMIFMFRRSCSKWRKILQLVLDIKYNRNIENCTAKSGAVNLKPFSVLFLLFIWVLFFFAATFSVIIAAGETHPLFVNWYSKQFCQTFRFTHMCVWMWVLWLLK